MNVRVETGGRASIPHPTARLLGSKTGIVRKLLHYLPDRSDPDVFYSTAIESDLSEVAGIDQPGALEAGGTAVDLLGARLRTLGEAAERYCLYFPDRDGLVEASHAELRDAGRDVIPFEYVDVFDHDRVAEVGLRRVTPTMALAWQAGSDLLTGEEVLVPTQQVWLPRIDGRDRWYPTTSNGSACAPSMAGALVGAITERIERDAVMRTWYRQLTPRSVAVDPEGGLGRLVSSRFETDHRRVRFLRFESPVDVPVAGCVAFDRRDRAPKFVIGGAADPSISRALRGALLETAQSWAYLKDLVVRERDRSIDPDGILNLEDNLLYYAFPERFSDVSFLIDGPAASLGEPVGGDRPPTDRLATLLAALERADLTPIAVDVTTRDIRQVGLHVARVVIPELLDLALPSLPPVGHPALAGHQLSRKPHPYP